MKQDQSCWVGVVKFPSEILLRQPLQLLKSEFNSLNKLFL